MEESKATNSTSDEPPSLRRRGINSAKTEKSISNNQLEELDSRTQNVDSNSSIVFFPVNMFIKSINLLIFIVKFPVWFVYRSYMFIHDPFGIISKAKSYAIGKVMRILGITSGSVSSYVYEWLKERDLIWKVGIKCGWGILWSGYVSVILGLLMVLAFFMGGFVVKCVVEEPLRIKEIVNFDYAEKSPVAYVALTLHPVLPPNHRLQVTVSLKLPESDYNRNLGVFQVRVDLLDANGRTLASSRRPCILQFKSDIIRHVLTFLNVAPLITGYASESQTMNINFRGFAEGSRTTAGLRVIIEQRAEFEPGGGIPEIYAASLALESELPLLKRVMWYWKKTLFVWISLTLFIVELFFTLLCCKPLVIPRIKLRENSATRDPDVSPRVQGS